MQFTKQLGGSIQCQRCGLVSDTPEEVSVISRLHAELIAKGIEDASHDLQEHVRREFPELEVFFIRRGAVGIPTSSVGIK